MLCVYVGFIGQQESLETVLSSGSFTGSGPAWTHLRLSLHLHTALCLRDAAIGGNTPSVSHKKKAQETEYSTFFFFFR